MMRLLSPHLDDAVLSCGQLMSTHPCEVITVYAGMPADVRLSNYDRARGFASTRDAVLMRRSEDDAAVRMLRCRPRHLDFLDGQYLDVKSRADRGVLALAEITRAVAALVDPTEHMLAPLGLGHPDHRSLSQCARNAVEHGELLLYEELPYRVLNPEEVWLQLEDVYREGWHIDELTWPPPNGAGDLDLKRKAIATYRSQFPNGAEDPCLLVPERVWRCTR